jgi:anhydro-N-acetylmuramic acid kinase
VADFRRKDVALGGQGAPFAPAFHRFLFGGDQSVGVVNIGGMANITILGEQTIGYDTGVGNALLDLWAKRAFDLAYDEDGIRAQAGMVDYALLVQMLADPYFRMHPPKSTGREYFNEAWLEQQLIGFEEVSAKDIQATLTALTVQTIGNEAKRFRLKKLYVCGGGVKNSFLMQSLQDYLAPVDVIPTDEMGVSSQALEAMAFAWLAYKRVQGERVELSSVTGATHDTILGGIYE